jgi:hypothetical protein
MTSIGSSLAEDGNRDLAQVAEKGVHVRKPKKKKRKLAYFSREFLVYIPLVFHSMSSSKSYTRWNMLVSRHLLSFHEGSGSFVERKF